MPSIEESKRQVKAALASQHNDDHDAILANLQDEIDRHHAESSSLASDKEKRRRHHNHESEHPLRFRFKSGTSDPRERKRKYRSGREDRHHPRKGRRTHERAAKDEAAHPFPREPTDPERRDYQDPNAAFRESLFDALADDEGAAYWESVYNQPIHVYPRPNVESAKGELEQMNDEQYAAFVQTKMWEKKHPHIVQERERKEQEKRGEEEERARRREEFIRRKERAAWERAQSDGARKFAGLRDEDEDGGDYEYVFDHEDRKKGQSSQYSSKTEKQKQYETAWRDYLAAWDKLKLELLSAQGNSDSSAITEPAKRLPWPVIQSKPVTRPNIQDFMRHISNEQTGRSKVQLLKAERVRWHPDKIQQRFGGKVDEGTMKFVTGVFQVIDAVLAEEQR